MLHFVFLLWLPRDRHHACINAAWWRASALLVSGPTYEPAVSKGARLTNQQYAKVHSDKSPHPGMAKLTIWKLKATI